MKKISILLFLLAAFGLYACTQDEVFVDGTPSKGLTAEIPSYEFEGNSTRVNISENLSTYTWENGDKIGIYYTSGTTYADAIFTLKQGGSSHGEFYNEAFSLRPNSTYYAFYPYNSEAMVDSYPIDFTGQVQTANGSTSHIGTRNYMSAKVNTDANGAANIAFQNQASVIQLTLPIEKTDTYTGVTLSTADADFITKGTLNMKTDSIISTSKSREIKVTFDQGISMSKGGTLTVNLLVAPVDLSGKTFSVAFETEAEIYLFENLEGMSIQKGKAYKVNCKSGMIVEIPYLTFTAEAEQTLRMSKAVETLEYSVNSGEWQTLEIYTVTFGGVNGDLRVRGKSAMGTATSGPDYPQISFGNSTKVACSGDIRTLIDYENYATTSTENARFGCLFQDCTCLTSAPELPATTLANHCYYCMFNGCSSLTSAPKLPATTLASAYYCYYSMFKGCTSLTSAPELPATTLADHCYYSMFEDCSSLTIAPELPATTLSGSGYCYYSMFKGCTNLISAPKLSATTLANCCYYHMFENCTSLKAAPELPATILRDRCYALMFYGCTSLEVAPELPATSLTICCYQYMFGFCSSLKEAPALQANKLSQSCYMNMFTGCTSLTSAPELPATTLAALCYQSMFSDCTSLTTAPELPALTLVYSCYSNMFYRCTQLNYIKMMATDISADYCLYGWTYDVSSTGTFVKNTAATWDVRGYDGIPTDWTVEEAKL